MPSPLGEGQTDMPISYHYLGEVCFNRWLRKTFISYNVMPQLPNQTFFAR
jgi:hypothetical protein